MHICVSSVIAGQEVWPQSQFVSLLIVFPLLEVGGWLSLLGVDALCGVVVHARAGVVSQSISSREYQQASMSPTLCAPTSITSCCTTDNTAKLDI